MKIIFYSFALILLMSCGEVSTSPAKPSFSSIVGISSGSNEVSVSNEYLSSAQTGSAISNQVGSTISAQNGSSSNVQANKNCDFSPKIIGFHVANSKNPALAALPYLTHLFLFSISPGSDGSFANYSAGGRNRWLEIIPEAKKQGVKVFATIGGAGDLKSGHFSKIMASASLRENFINASMDEVKALDLDGIDIDWEFPKTDADMDNFIILLADLKAKLNAEGKELSVDLDRSPRASVGAKALFKIGLLEAVDFINLMTYDHSLRNGDYEATLYNINEYIEAGVPYDKMNFGVPFYGRKGNFTMDYFNIVLSYEPSPDSDEQSDYYYNGITTLKKKVDYVVDNKMQGLMIWELSQDVTYNDLYMKYALLPAIHKQFIPLWSF
jgi:spore germination protein YaaH